MEHHAGAALTGMAVGTPALILADVRGVGLDKAPPVHLIALDAVLALLLPGQLGDDRNITRVHIDEHEVLEAPVGQGVDDVLHYSIVGIRHDLDGAGELIEGGGLAHLEARADNGVGLGGHPLADSKGHDGVGAQWELGPVDLIGTAGDDDRVGAILDCLSQFGGSHFFHPFGVFHDCSPPIDIFVFHRIWDVIRERSPARSSGGAPDREERSFPSSVDAASEEEPAAQQHSQQQPAPDVSKQRAGHDEGGKDQGVLKLIGVAQSGGRGDVGGCVGFVVGVHDLQEQQASGQNAAALAEQADAGLKLAVLGQDPLAQDKAGPVGDDGDSYADHDQGDGVGDKYAQVCGSQSGDDQVLQRSPGNAYYGGAVDHVVDLGALLRTDAEDSAEDQTAGKQGQIGEEGVDGHQAGAQQIAPHDDQADHH